MIIPLRALLLVFLLFSGCGVKLAPVAPAENPEPANLNLDCSPTDPKCDKQDPNYKPEKALAILPAREANTSVFSLFAPCNKRRTYATA